MILNLVTEIEVITVLSRGIPNEECIAIKANDWVNLGQYGVMLGVYYKLDSAIPYQDNLFWFGDGLVEKNDWIFIYTGDGRPTSSKTIDKHNNVYSLFWGKKNTIFANSNIVPILFRVDAVNVLRPQANLPQIGL